METNNRKLSLGAFLYQYGHHYAAWRHPNSVANGPVDLEYYKRSALAAERGKFDMVFLADSGSIPSIEEAETSVSFLYPEAITVLGALAGLTERIGLAGTVSTTFNEPYNLARRMATLDHLSAGRAAWNVVTSTKESEARNFNSDHLLEHSKRYERAKEFIDVVTKLWDSWEDEAAVGDKEIPRFADTSRIHPILHNGEHFRVDGPLNIPRMPQGRPVIIEAGTSPAGQHLAAQTADIVFTACEDKKDAIRFYSQIKAQLAQFGRSPEQLKVMPGLLTFIGDTEEEAREQMRAYNELIPPKSSVQYLEKLLNTDLTGFSIDEQLPKLPREGNTSRAVMIMDMAEQTNMTIRELGLHFSAARGHLTVVGTPVQIADRIEEWFTSYACDGFNIMAPLLPDGLDQFVAQVVPILQERGLFRTEYIGSTLREHLGLDRPVSQFTQQHDIHEVKL